MKKNTVEIWKPIAITDAWRKADTSKLDDIAPSWYSKRQTLDTNDQDYKEFLDRLKRQHAIETGIVERLYDLSVGVTETFIKEGFVESYIQHGDTNISPRQLMAHLNDHFEAMDFVFDLVKQERPLTEHFIRSLHQLITQNQDYTEAIDQLGNRKHVPLLKGKYKEHPNNPSRVGREGEQIYLYCPPEQVEAEMQQLVQLYETLLEEQVSPVIISAWLHHAFTQIHPFQDGNGRVARMLASLVLIQAGLFPLTIRRTEKSRYIDALEQADRGQPEGLVQLFSEIQKKSIEAVLNWQMETPAVSNSLQEAAKALSKRVDTWTMRRTEERQAQFDQNRMTIFGYIYELMGVVKEELQQVIPEAFMTIALANRPFNQENSEWYTHSIVEYAKKHDYFFNRNLPRAWFKVSFTISKERIYELIVTFHHYSYDDSVMAIGGVIQYRGSKNTDELEADERYVPVPISVEPYTLSLEAEPTKLRKNVEVYVRDLVTIAVQQITKSIF